MDSLIEDLDNENESIRSNAMDELVGMGDEKTIGSLVQVVQNENLPLEMRKNAIVSLGKIGDNGTTELFLDISMNESENKHLRMASILALGDLGDEEALESLRELSYGDDGLILYHAAYVLAPLNDIYEVYGTYGELPYPLTEEQRSYRNNVGEIVFGVNFSEFPPIVNSSMTLGHDRKTGYIEVMTDVNPGTSSMDEMYRIISTEAEKRGVYQVPVRFVYGTFSFA
ncbi:HEAT repeat domain-containing protein [Methanococcoides orientis]|uniref:HEAT repeat domain-containing protein n=1 Tax=Methanococcoides orientis TaxID=2822137 RepID=UPI001E544EF3|nr:HEAT repeat domain-containing protein [Methanococcoides orientis]UGV40248.1 HEAT repeat domain-containing protein [Methanococcoides orientis]